MNKHPECSKDVLVRLSEITMSFDKFYSFLVEKERDVAKLMLEDCCSFILADKSCGTKFQREGLVKKLRYRFRPRSRKELALEVLQMIENRDSMFLDKYQLKLIRDGLEEVVGLLEDE